MRYIRLLFISLTLVFLVNCSAELPTPKSSTPAQKVTLSEEFQVLGKLPAAGGKVCSAGGVCLQVPANAVEKDTELSAKVVAKSQEGTVGPVYELSASQETFAEQASLQLPVPAGHEQKELEVVFWKDEAWVAVETRVADNGKARVGLTDHLSRWSLRAKAKKPSGCRSESDCTRGQVCQNHKCVTPKSPSGCKSDSDCSRGEACYRGKCTRPPVTPGCQSDSDCKSNEQCSRGQCTPRPTSGCRSDSDCKSNEQCSRGQCTPKPGCQSDRDCKANEQCSRGQCTPKPPAGCKSDSDCPRGKTCSRGKCTVPPTSGCQSHRDCKNNEACIRGTCTPQNPPSCRSNSECIKGYICDNNVCTKTSSCQRGQTLCGRSCVSLQTDNANCGACGKVCSRGQRCSRGSCQGACTPSPETCDGKDNDCDGSIDEGLTRPCYSGPRGTANVGTCKAGIQKCSSGRWSICTGEVKPQSESCRDRVDNDCDGQVNEGCSSSPNTCKSDGDCKASGERCIRGTCALQCRGGYPCPAGTGCQAGGCFPCPKGQTACKGHCYDLQTSFSDCGACGRACGLGQQCVSGACKLKPGCVNPKREICGNQKDDDCDGKIDELCPCKKDSDCYNKRCYAGLCM